MSAAASNAREEASEAWTSCLDCLDMNVYCCRHDFKARDLPPRLQRAIRALCAVSLVISFTELIVGAYVSSFFNLPQGSVHLGCWWVSLVWMVSSICGCVCRDRAWVMACGVLSLLGVPIGIGGAASDAAGYKSYTSNPPMGCAQIGVGTTQAPGAGSGSGAHGVGHRRLDQPLFSHHPYAGRELQHATTTAKNIPRIASFGPSPATAALARQCLSTLYLQSPSSVSLSSCYCTIPASGLPSQDATGENTPIASLGGLQCQRLDMDKATATGGCGNIYTSFLPNLKARYVRPCVPVSDSVSVSVERSVPSFAGLLCLWLWPMA